MDNDNAGMDPVGNFTGSNPVQDQNNGYGNNQTQDQNNGYGNNQTQDQNNGYGNNQTQDQGNGYGNNQAQDQGNGYGNNQAQDQGNGYGNNQAQDQNYGYGNSQAQNPGYGYGQPQGGYQQELEEPMRLSEWVVTLLLLLFVPCVNIVLLFVWAFSKKEKKSKSNFCKAYLIISGILLALWLIVAIVIAVVSVAVM